MLVERGAWVVTGYPDTDYEQAGAKLIDDHAALFAEGDLVVKVKEPLPEESGLMRPGQVLFTYFHHADSRFSKQPKAVQRTALHDAVAAINAPLLCRSHSTKRIDRPLPPLPAVINSPDAKGRECGHPQGDRGVPRVEG